MSGYFLYHSIGTYPGKRERMAAALDDFTNTWCASDDGQWPAALTLRQRYIDELGALMGATPGSLTLAENVTAALYSLIGALPAHHLAGKRLLIAEDCFPSMHFLLARLADRFGYTLHTVARQPGADYVTDEDFMAEWDERVGLALVTWVSSLSSHRCDLSALAAHSRRQGSLMVVDVTQGIGISPLNVEAGIDCIIGSSLKWLGGCAGAGYLYVEPALLATCRPELCGWFSQDNPFSWDLDRFDYAPDARRFDHGTPAILAAAASLPGLQYVREQGIAQLAAHNRQLTGMLMDAMQSSAAYRLVTPRDDNRRGGSVMLRVARGEEAARSLLARLRTEGFHCDNRGDTLRLSPGSITTQTETTALCAALERLA